MSHIRQNYGADCETAINKQINLELHASYVYMSMAWYFDRDDIALHGFHKYFHKMSCEEREHAEKLMKFQNERGGRIKFAQIDAPERNEWGTGLDAMKIHIELEKNVNTQLLAIHKMAESSNDAQMADFIADEFLSEQVESIKKACNYVTMLQKAGPGLGEYMFDRETLQE